MYSGSPYHNDIISIEVNVDAAKDYIQAKADSYMNDMVDELRQVLNKHNPWKN